MIGPEKPEVARVQSDEVELPGVAKPSVCERLDSWKEIASYMRRSIRCVQRWERNEGLPILRHPHAKGSSVYSFRQELDRWWHGTKNATREENWLQRTALDADTLPSGNGDYGASDRIR